MAKLATGLLVVAMIYPGCHSGGGAQADGGVDNGSSVEEPLCKTTADCPVPMTCWTTGVCWPDPEGPCVEGGCDPGFYCNTSVHDFCPECKNSSGCLQIVTDAGQPVVDADGVDGQGSQGSGGRQGAAGVGGGGGR